MLVVKILIQLIVQEGGEVSRQTQGQEEAGVLVAVSLALLLTPARPPARGGAVGEDPRGVKLKGPKWEGRGERRAGEKGREGGRGREDGRRGGEEGIKRGGYRMAKVMRWGVGVVTCEVPGAIRSPAATPL